MSKYRLVNLRCKLLMCISLHFHSVVYLQGPLHLPSLRKVLTKLLSKKTGKFMLISYVYWTDMSEFYI